MTQSDMLMLMDEKDPVTNFAFNTLWKGSKFFDTDSRSQRELLK